MKPAANFKNAAWVWCSRLLFERTIWALTLLLCAAMAIILWHLDRLSTGLIQSAALEAAARQSEVLEQVRTVYTSEVSERVRAHGIEVTHDYLEPKWEGKAIPLPATLTMLVGEGLAQGNSQLQVRLYSDHPFRPDRGTLDAFEREALQHLQEDPRQPFARIEDYQGRRSLRYATADIMRAKCINCHNSHPDSPKTDWKEGDVRGVLEIIRPLDKVEAQSQAGKREAFALMVVIGGLGLSGLGIVVGRLRRTSAELESQVQERTAALRNTNSKLEQEVAERKRAEEDLRRTGQELARSNAELAQFASVASHDLQEPLRTVSSFVQLLARRYQGKFDKDADEYIAFTVDAISRLHGLINDLLEYSRVGTQGKSPQPVACDVILGRVLDNLKTTIEETGAQITHDALPEVRADATQLMQLFQNLIGNSIKFSGPRQPVIHIGVERRPDEWLLWVSDNGIGIDPKFAERIFVIFQRLHGRGDYPGSGVGLAICKKIVERHGGRIWVESDPGKGSTFYFTLPSGGDEP